jgi:hypothetical protein
MTEPTLNRKSVDRVARKLCELGATTEDLAEVFATSEEDMKRLLQAKGDFSRACANGRIAAANKISNALLKHAVGMNITQRKIISLDGMAAQIVVEENRPPDLKAANAVLGDFRQRDEIGAHNALRTADEISFEEEAMAILRGSVNKR